MRHRLFLQRANDHAIHFQIVELSPWATRKERQMRNAPMADPKTMADNAALKRAFSVTPADCLAS